MTAEPAPSWLSHVKTFASQVLIWPAGGLILAAVMTGEYRETTFDFVWGFLVLVTFVIAGWRMVVPLRLEGYRVWRLFLLLFVIAIVADGLLAIMAGVQFAANTENALNTLFLMACGSLGMLAGAITLRIRSRS